MRSSTRPKVRIDYQILNSSGEKVEKLDQSNQPEESETVITELSNLLTNCSLHESKMADSKEGIFNKLMIEESTIYDDMNDFIDENSIEDNHESLEDLDNIISKTENFRTIYRSKHKELEACLGEEYHNRYASTFMEQIAKLKQFITDAKNAKRAIRSKEDQKSNEEREAKNKVIDFTINNVLSVMENLEAEVKTDIEETNDDELLRRKENKVSLFNTIENLSNKIKDILEQTSLDYKRRVTTMNLTQRYETLLMLQRIYSDKLFKEISKRELEKQSAFNNLSLNIKLSKFRGYNSPVDIFTFQRDFEKLYLKSTPKSMLPDLLKNNFLEDPALSLVKSVNDIAQIWIRLKQAYGDSKIMLSKKLAEINNIDVLWKVKTPAKIAEGLSKVINLMKDLMELSKFHNIENKLYNGDAIERIYKLLGDSRITRWLSSSCDENLEDAELWNKLIEFLEKDIRVQQQKALLQESTNSYKSKDPKHPQSQSHHSGSGNYLLTPGTCYICGETNHTATNGPGGTKVIQYFSCKKFVEMNPAERFRTLMKKGLCFQCLFPGAKRSDPKHKDGKCQRDFICQHPYHDDYQMKKHVIVCSEHKNTQINQDLFDLYKSKCILKQTSVNLPKHSMDMQLSFHVDVNCSEGEKRCSGDNNAIYQLQTIEVNGKKFSLFFDSGCGDFVSRYDAIKRIGNKSKQEHKGPVKIGGVGGLMTKSPYGIYSVKLPLYDGSEAVMSGVCLDQITSTFPTYPLQGKVMQDIVSAYRQSGGKANDLPKIPQTVGGDTDFMIGIKYLRYYPQVIFQLPSGLTIYESLFCNPDGGRGIIGGPHQIFNNIGNYHQLKTNSNFFTNQYQLYRNGYQINPDVSILGFKNKVNTDIDDETNKKFEENDETIDSNVFAVRCEKLFRQVEEAGSVINYRCLKCRSCSVCKNHDQIEEISIREEVEQDVINQSVKVDLQNRTTIARLPVMHNPVIKLHPNKDKALKVFNQQLKKLNKNQKDKDDVIKSEEKLQKLGHVDYVKNLSLELQEMLRNNKIQNFIPWRAVWKETSISTPCRVVFDASQATSSGFSLNDILAKGRNNMNKLVEIVIRWYTHQFAFHTDVQKMYNSVKLQEEDWCLQRYIWQENLDPTKIPEEKVIKTLIYGVKSSGNQAEYGLRETARLSKEDYPEINEIVNKDVYVDDCITGEMSEKHAMKRADELEIVLNRGGYTLKGITFSNHDPPESLTDDGISIGVAGMKWYSKEDKISLNIGELNFAKKLRGKKPSSSINQIPEKLTRRHCVAKVAEIFDISGKLTPITAAMKLDLHELVLRKLDWDDVVPDTLRPIWNSHFEMMNEINNIKFNRAVVPEDAVNLNIETLEFGDASKQIACVAVYARFKRRNGYFSCQLVFARSKLVPSELSQPRAELFAALLNTHTGEVVRRSFQKRHQNSVRFSDSQIVLYWINNEDRPLKQWVRNRVAEIRRFSNVSQWNYINTSEMIADIGTRRGTKLKDIDQNSTWINGFKWMHEEKENFPMKQINQLKLQETEMKEIQNEIPLNSSRNKESEVFHYLSEKQNKNIPTEVNERYVFSNYLIDPNRHRFATIVRIMAYVLKFINFTKIKQTSKNRIEIHVKKDIKECYKFIQLSNEDIKASENYFFSKASKEVKHFNNERNYRKFTREQDGIIKYVGRILATDNVTIVGKYTNTMQDLTSTSFCVPVVDKYSPLAYSIINEVHWHSQVAKHSGVETTWRYVLKIAFIIEGRELVKKIKKLCERCRYLEMKTIDVAMGPISKHNTVIAPAFFITQVDLAGPFSAYSKHNKRTTLKIWLAVFCCSTTSTVSIKIMEDYGTTSFIQAFTRLSCEVGYPKLLLIDEGSQLVKACESMVLNFTDIKNQLHTSVGVQFEVCPVGGHNMHGKVERKIKEIKRSISKNVGKERLSVLQWETICSVISNTINDMPLALGNLVSNFETMDLLTPNRLKLGRNNERSPVGSVTISNNYDKILNNNKNIYNSWFENWLLNHVPKLMEQPKWFKTDYDLKPGDIVLFLKNESLLTQTYQYGMVASVSTGRDGVIRKVNVKYRNQNENVDRETSRSTRQLVMIHPVDELSLMQELGEIACAADVHYSLMVDM